MPVPSFATFNGTYYWSDATVFDGFVVAVLAYPGSYTQVLIANQSPVQRIGDHVKVRITAGVPDGSAHLYYNGSLDPPNTKWCFYWYAADGTLVYTPTNATTELFTVSTSPYTLPTVSIVKPTAAAAIPAV